MKKQILSFAIAATIIGSIAAGCSSEKSASSSADSTAMKDSMSNMNTTPPASTDTMKMKTDSMKMDTAKKM